jgi:SPP1 gp7 family putative phage head morphogenesis protein
MTNFLFKRTLRRLKVSSRLIKKYELYLKRRYSNINQDAYNKIVNYLESDEFDIDNLINETDKILRTVRSNIDVGSYFSNVQEDFKNFYLENLIVRNNINISAILASGVAFGALLSFASKNKYTNENEFINFTTGERSSTKDTPQFVYIDKGVRVNSKETFRFNMLRKFSDPKYIKTLDNKISENIDLITKLDLETKQKITRVINEGVNKRLSFAELKSNLKDVTKFTDYRSNLIAQDQMLKFYGANNYLIQKDLGVERYKWLTSADERVRKTHKANSGQIFEWDNPPVTTGHPKTDIRCRCQAIPYFET